MADAPNVAYHEDGLEVQHQGYSVPFSHNPPPGLQKPPTESWTGYPGHEQTQRGRTICGLQHQTFWLLIVLAIVVVGAAVGGGVGGSLAVQAAR